MSLRDRLAGAAIELNSAMDGHVFRPTNRRNGGTTSVSSIRLRRLTELCPGWRDQ